MDTVDTAMPQDPGQGIWIWISAYLAFSVPGAIPEVGRGEDSFGLSTLGSVPQRRTPSCSLRICLMTSQTAKRRPRGHKGPQPPASSLPSHSPSAEHGGLRRKACWVAGEEMSIVIVEKKASSDHVSTLNQPPLKTRRRIRTRGAVGTQETGKLRVHSRHTWEESRSAHPWFSHFLPPGLEAPSLPQPTSEEIPSIKSKISEVDSQQKDLRKIRS